MNKATDAVWEWAKEHKADIAGVGVGIVVGVGCAALTGGAGAVACGALGGAAQSLTKSLINGDSAATTAINTVSGAAFGAATGGLSAGVSGTVTGTIQNFSLGKGLRAGGAAFKESFAVTRTAVKDLAPKAVAKFVAASKGGLREDVHRIGKGGLAKAIGKDMLKAARSPAGGLAPAGLAGALPSDYSDVQKYFGESWSYSWWNVVPPLFTGGFV